MNPDTLTLQAVADELGVDRKTLRRHVSDRDGLMAMLASEALQVSFSESEFLADPDWRESIRAFATITRDGIIAMGGLAGYVNFRSDAGLQDLSPAEATLESLVAAGFGEQTAGRILGFIAEFAFTSGRNAISKRSEGGHPQTPELQTALASSDVENLPVLRHVVESQDPFDEEQFEFDIRVLILGAERLLETDGE